ncbi:MAG: hypothetical protein G4A98_02665 [Buchnera aphidicola (Microlophium carnosum)]|uniref:Uncharacterized protein n=1 Tax=Buchnera aphidicola (Microlophium carnosum) TaxID=2708354 RepID=A0A6G9JTK8_9GAMM|nr:MAG: hypothetical protein G4A98_02665 [Buchnera aphidicola (Microlophium carnosum)]
MSTNHFKRLLIIFNLDIILLYFLIIPEKNFLVLIISITNSATATATVFPLYVVCHVFQSFITDKNLFVVNMELIERSVPKNFSRVKISGVTL